MYIKRSMEKYIETAGNDFKAILVTGARQAGKSTLLKHLFPERAYLTFDDLNITMAGSILLCSLPS